MTRCDRRRALRGVIASALAALSLAAVAQPQVARGFPQNALRGELLLQSPNDVLVNGVPARLAPGLRIRGQDNLMIVSGAILGQKFVGHYTVDSYGLLNQIWVLRPDEIANQPWPRTAAETAAWAFDPVGQRWAKP